MQRKLISVREYYLKQMAEQCSTVMRDTVEQMSGIARLFEDAIRLEPAIAETVQVDLMNLQEWRRKTARAADIIDGYVDLIGRRPSLREPRKYCQTAKAAAAADETPQENA